ncbi:hypothetical protein Ahy_A05g022019 isoform E [Arachis hypogaea]|uniref:Uncharacterized protein n=1 Tax=Arachis hypogaea TaxID=3818 RepID=A0A445CZD5_ARAHY|nr:hypothetical protein Ahy_A05g022019 isoform E [Arachis hypogaea]
MCGFQVSTSRILSLFSSSMCPFFFEALPVWLHALCSIQLSNQLEPNRALSNSMSLKFELEQHLCKSKWPIHHSKFVTGHKVKYIVKELRIT